MATKKNLYPTATHWGQYLVETDKNELIKKLPLNDHLLLFGVPKLEESPNKGQSVNEIKED